MSGLRVKLGRYSSGHWPLELRAGDQALIVKRVTTADGAVFDMRFRRGERDLPFYASPEELVAPKVWAEFQAQQWVGHNEDTCMPIGEAVEFDVTDKILQLPYEKLKTFKDGSYDSDDLAADLPERRKHGGPFEVYLVTELDEWLGEMGYPDREALTAEQWQQVHTLYPLQTKSPELRTVSVPLVFRGVAEIEVPAKLEDWQAKLLAQKLALAQILATFDNPDCGECLELASQEFVRDTDLPSSVFDMASAKSVSGVWRKEEHG